MRQGEVGHRGEGIVSHDGKHECAANHVAWNKHIALSHCHQFSGNFNDCCQAQVLIPLWFSSPYKSIYNKYSKQSRQKKHSLFLSLTRWAWHLVTDLFFWPIDSNLCFLAKENDVIHKLPKARFSRRGVMWLWRWLLRVITRMLKKLPNPPGKSNGMRIPFWLWL